MFPDTIYLHPAPVPYRRFLDARLATVGLAFGEVEPYWESAIARTRERFGCIRNKYYQADPAGVPLRAGHVGHTTLFLYELSRQAWLQNDQDVANLLYFLNVSGGGCNILHEIEIPLRTFCDHPCGAVIGRGHFAADASLSFSTNCNIGNSRNVYPRVEGNLTMLPNSSVLGDTRILGNVIMSNGSRVLDAGDIRDVIVYGVFPANTFRPLDSASYHEIANFKH